MEIIINTHNKEFYGELTKKHLSASIKGSPYSVLLSFTDVGEADWLQDEGERLSPDTGLDYIPLSARIDW